MPCFCGTSVNVMKPILSKVTKRKKPQKKPRDIDKIRDEIAKALQNHKCVVPMQCMDKCRFPMPQSTNNLYNVDRSTYLEDMDPFWADFLRKQYESGASNLFNTHVYGPDKDPTCMQRSRFSGEIIHQRLLHMPMIGSLKRSDMHLMLTLILNLTQLSAEEQDECIQYMLRNDIVNVEILHYMDLVARHPNAGLSTEDKNNIHRIIQNLINSTIKSIDTPYFNPDHIFKKSLIEIDPYELAYLKTIMHTPPDEELNKSQYVYLVNFVDLLQNMSPLQRDEALKILYKRCILPTDDFQLIVQYMEDRSKGHPFDSNRLKYVLEQFDGILKLPPPNDAHLYEASFKEEEAVSKKKANKSAGGAGPCGGDSDEPRAQVQNLHLDVEQLHDTFKVLMNGSTNTGRLYELKQFIKKLLAINSDDLEVTLAYLKDSYSIYIPEFQFTAEFIESGRIKGNHAKLNELAKVLRCIMKLPVGFRIPSNGYYCRRLPDHYQNRTKRKGKFDEDLPVQPVKRQAEPTSPQTLKLMAAMKPEETTAEPKEKSAKEGKAKGKKTGAKPARGKSKK